MHYFLSILTLALSTAAFAGDAYTFKSLGFSSNGAFYAFAQTAISDGSGYPIARASVVEVKSNKEVKLAIVHLEKDGATEKDALNAAVAKLNLAIFAITPGAKPGTPLLRRLPTDKSTYTSSTVARYNAGGGSIPHTPLNEFVVTETAITAGQNDFCYDEPKLLKLTVKSQNVENGSEILTTLQDEKTLPKIRKCASDYSIREIIANGNDVVVALTYRTPGFEGPSFEFMVVSGAGNLQGF